MTVPFDAFESQRVQVGGSTVFLTRAGSGPALLLLHGFPETHMAWRKVAPHLTDSFTVVAADLPGYGDSIGPEPDAGHTAYSKRAMGQILADAMAQLGFRRFAVVGHDRGARVAYRLSLDQPALITSLAILDVIPSLVMAERLTYTTARQIVNWFWLAQPPPVPEMLIGANPDVYLSYIINAWGGSGMIEDDARGEYARCFRNPRVIRAICEEYRAGDTDIENDRVDAAAGRRIVCPVLVLWARDGLASQFGDPLAIWGQWAGNVTGQPLGGGHFMMEESPEVLAGHLLRFFRHVSHMDR
jgi:haloacetate dehalogenase